MFCKNCGKEISEGAKFCSSCGTAIGNKPRVCASCGTEIEEGAVFCANCGAALPFAAPTEKPKEYSTKSKLAAGLFGIFLGGLGVHSFYMGNVGIGVAQIFVTLITCGFGSLWGFIEGIVILASNEPKDSEGKIMKD